MIRLDHIFWQLIQCSFLIHSEDAMAISEEIRSEHKKKLYCAGNSPTSCSFIWSMIGGLVSVTIPTLLSSISNNVVEKRCRSSSKYLLLPTQASDIICHLVSSKVLLSVLNSANRNTCLITILCHSLPAGGQAGVCEYSI